MIDLILLLGRKGKVCSVQLKFSWYSFVGWRRNINGYGGFGVLHTQMALDWRNSEGVMLRVSTRSSYGNLAREGDLSSMVVYDNVVANLAYRLDGFFFEWLHWYFELAYGWHRGRNIGAGFGFTAQYVARFLGWWHNYRRHGTVSGLVAQIQVPWHSELAYGVPTIWHNGAGNGARPGASLGQKSGALAQWHETYNLKRKLGQANWAD